MASQNVPFEGSRNSSAEEENDFVTIVAASGIALQFQSGALDCVQGIRELHF